MTVYRITIVNDDTSDVLDIIYTDEPLFDIKHAIDNHVSTYDTREELDEANRDLEGEDNEDGDDIEEHGSHG
jgi:hypothetical protein